MHIKVNNKVNITVNIKRHIMSEYDIYVRQILTLVNDFYDNFFSTRTGGHLEAEKCIQQKM